MKIPGVRKAARAPIVTDEQEAELIRRIGLREREALTELYGLYHRRLARFLTRFIRQYEVVQEIVNDTLFVVWQRADSFRGGSRVSTWIMGIAYRRALKALREVTAHAGDVSFAEEFMPETANPIDALEQRALLDQALATLPLDQRVVLELTYYAGYSCEEIACIVDCPVNTVKTRMFYARRKLKDLVPQLGGWSTS